MTRLFWLSLVSTILVSSGFALADGAKPVRYVGKSVLPQKLRESATSEKSLSENFFSAQVTLGDSSDANKNQTSSAKNCKDLWDQMEKGHISVNDGSDTMTPNCLAACTELKILHRLKPSNKTFLPSSKLSALALPAAILLSDGEPAWFDQLYRASGNGTSCASYLKTLGLSLRADAELKCAADALAYGDWDGDGIEDVIVSNSLCGGHICSTYYFVLTKLKAEEPYRLIDAWADWTDQFNGVENIKIEPNLKSAFNDKADLSCSGDALDQERDSFKKLYDHGKVEEAFTQLNQFYSKCKTFLADTQKIKALGELTLAAMKTHSKQSCNLFAAELKSLDLSHAETAAVKAVKFNLGRCN